MTNGGMFVIGYPASLVICIVTHSKTAKRRVGGDLVVAFRTT